MPSLVGDDTEAGTHSNLQQLPPVTLKSLGGPCDIPALCVLDGYVVNDQMQPVERFRLPITGVPATLGRDHPAQEDPTNYFFGMGSLVKAISRQHCRIEYWVDERGHSLILDKEDKVFKLIKAKRKRGAAFTNYKFINPTGVEIPRDGFYVLTCLGKNRTVVNGRAVTQGQSCILVPNSAIKISSLLFYFLLPAKPLNETISVDLPAFRKRSSNSTPAKSSTNETDNAPSPSTEKSSSNPPSPEKPSPAKRARSATIDSNNDGDDTPKKHPGSRAWVGLQASVDKEDTDTLLEEINTAITDDLWERRHQAIGATLAFRAILDASKDPKIQHLGTTQGVSRGQIMDWIENSEKYKRWVRQMNIKIEPKSYQASITKALLRANFQRTNTTGRYIRWMIPPELQGDGPLPTHMPGSSINDDDGSENDEDEDDDQSGSEGGSELDDMEDDERDETGSV